MTNLVERFDALFSGRRDMWGAVHGECVREPLTQDYFRWHLEGDGSIGVYPLVDGQVRWGCSDIDMGYDLIALAKNLQKALKHLGIVSWIERTKGKGFHVWVFVSDWVPAEQMRNALLVAHQIAGVPPREVNPKQVSGDGPGNYVNAAYAHNWVQEGKRVVIDTETGAALSVEDFVQQALSSINVPEAIEAAANLYVPPPPKRAVAIQSYTGDRDSTVRRLGGLAFTIFNDGPLEGRDRSTTLARLAHLCRDDGLSPSEAMEILTDADARWGKFHDRPDGAAQLRGMVERAYG